MYFYMTYEQSMDDVQEPITNAPPEVRKIIERVLQAEKDKLYMKVPRNINDDILKLSGRSAMKLMSILTM